LEAPPKKERRAVPVGRFSERFPLCPLPPTRQGLEYHVVPWISLESQLDILQGTVQFQAKPGIELGLQGKGVWLESEGLPVMGAIPGVLAELHDPMPPWTLVGDLDSDRFRMPREADIGHGHQRPGLAFRDLHANSPRTGREDRIVPGNRPRLPFPQQVRGPVRGVRPSKPKAHHGDCPHRERSLTEALPLAQLEGGMHPGPSRPAAVRAVRLWPFAPSRRKACADR